MSRLLGISIQNFGVLKNVRLGRLADALDAEPLGAITTFIGSNGTGKSSLVGVFDFLADCFKIGVSDACKKRNPGGFSHVRSQGSDDAIRFELLFQVCSEQPLLAYRIEFNSKDDFNSYVGEEELIQITPKQKNVLFCRGEGDVVDYYFEKDASKINPLKSSYCEMPGNDSPRLFKELQFFEEDLPFLPTYSSYSWIPSFSDKLLLFLKNSYLCRFMPELASKGQTTVLEPYLNQTCSNLNNVAAYMGKTAAAALQKINRSLQTKIPNFDRIEPIAMPNGQHELAIYQKSSPEPLYSANASDGTLKLFAYYLLLSETEGSKSRKLVCIEEPENGLYHTYLPDLACDIAKCADQGRQIFVTTHSPYFVDVLRPKNVWVLSRGKDGFVQARRASDFPFVNELIDEEIPLGDLWHNEYLEGED